MMLYRILFLSLCFWTCSYSVYAQKPINQLITIDNQLVEYYDGFARKDTVYLFGYRGLRYKMPNGYIFTKYLISKFYGSQFISHSYYNIDSLTDQFLYVPFLKSRNKLYILPRGGPIQYFAALDSFGKYLYHSKDTGEVAYPVLMSMIESPDKSILAVGDYVPKDGSQSKHHLFRYDTLGKMLWKKPNVSSLSSGYSSIILSLKNQPVIIANEGILTCNMSLFDDHNRLITLDSNGNVIKDVSEKRNKSIGSRGIFHNSNNLILVGSYIDTWFCSLPFPFESPYIKCLDSNAQLQWELRFPHRWSFQNGFRNVIKLKDGNYLAVGRVRDSIINGNADSIKSSGFVVKFTPQGSIVWRREYRVRDTIALGTLSELQKAVELSNGDLVCFGYYRMSDEDSDTSQPNQRGWLLKLTKNGDLVTTTAAIQETKQDVISFYPNPAKSKITIKSPYRIDKYILYDMQGRKIDMGDIMDNVIDLKSHVQTGQYILHCLAKDVVRFQGWLEVDRSME